MGKYLPIIVTADCGSLTRAGKILGYTQPNGQPSENLARVENFFNRWRKAHPEVPIEYYDERFTSVLAHRAMIDGGVKKKTRRENKGLVDEISATIILQDFMQSRR